MKQELVRTKSKISSLKREMSSIQQLHLAQQQVQAQLSAPTDIASRQELGKHHQAPSQPQLKRQPFAFTYAAETFTRSNAKHHQRQNVSTSSNDESLSPPATSNNSTCTAQSTQTTSRSSPSAIVPSATTRQDSSTQPPTRSSPSVASTSPSDEQLRLHLTETLQREKDSAV